MDHDQTLPRRLTAALTTLVALSALSAPGSAHTFDEDLQVAYTPIGEVCVNVAIGLATTAASPADLDELEALAAGGHVTLADGTADDALVQETLAVLRGLFPHGAALTTVSDDVVDDVLEAAECQRAEGFVTHTKPHVHRGTTVVETEAVGGEWDSLLSSGAWARASDTDDAGVVTLGPLPFASTDADGSVTRHALGAPVPDHCGVAVELTTAAVAPPAAVPEFDETSPLWPVFLIQQSVRDAVLPSVPLVVDADFCGLGFGVDSNDQYRLEKPALA